MKKRLFIIITSLLFAITGCSQSDFAIRPGKPDGEYATQNRNTSLEYSIYMNKQITSFVSLLNTRVVSIMNSDKVSNPLEIDNAKTARDSMKDIRDEIEITYPSLDRDDDRAAVLKQMDACIKSMDEYIDSLSKGNNVSYYADIFSEETNQLTGLAQMYYQ